MNKRCEKCGWWVKDKKPCYDNFFSGRCTCPVPQWVRHYTTWTSELLGDNCPCWKSNTSDTLAAIEKFRQEHPEAEADLAAYRAMFCPADCPDRYYVDALTGWTCKEWVCRLASLRTKVGVVVLKCQECYLKEGKCHS